MCFYLLQHTSKGGPERPARAGCGAGVGRATGEARGPTHPPAGGQRAGRSSGCSGDGEETDVGVRVAPAPPARFQNHLLRLRLELFVVFTGRWWS